MAELLPIIAVGIAVAFGFGFVYGVCRRIAHWGEDKNRGTHGK